MQLKQDFQRQRHKGHGQRSYGVLLGFINARAHAHHSSHHRQLKRYLTVHSSPRDDPPSDMVSPV